MYIFIDQYQNKIEILMIKGSKETLSVEELSPRFKKPPLLSWSSQKRPLIWNNGITMVCSKSDLFTLFLLISKSRLFIFEWTPRSILACALRSNTQSFDSTLTISTICYLMISSCTFKLYLLFWVKFPWFWPVLLIVMDVMDIDHDKFISRYFVSLEFKVFVATPLYPAKYSWIFQNKKYQNF